MKISVNEHDQIREIMSALTVVLLYIIALTRGINCNILSIVGLLRRLIQPKTPAKKALIDRPRSVCIPAYSFF